MYRIIILVLIMLTAFIIKPFINGLGCDFKINNDNQMVKHSITCKNGFVLSDFYDKTTETRTIRRSFYGFWGGYAYNIPFYKMKYIASQKDQQNSISKLTKYEILDLWSVYSVNSSKENIIYSFLKEYDGAILVSEFSTEPNRGFIE